MASLFRRSVSARGRELGVKRMPALTNAKHEAVAQAFIADGERIGWRAYRAVYPKCAQHTAESAFCALMKKPDFSARVAELAEAAAGVAVMTAHEVLVELTKIARADMADFIRAFACGDPVAAVDKLTPAHTAALGEVTVEQFLNGAGDDAREVRRIKFKLLAKVPALELLGKHHKLYVERREHEWGAGLADRLEAALARVRAQEENDPYYQARATPHEASGSRRPTDRRQRSPRTWRTSSERLPAATQSRRS